MWPDDLASQGVLVGRALSEIGERVIFPDTFVQGVGRIEEVSPRLLGKTHPPMN
ncbi:hypothetical protein AB6802_25145 [Mesorhizobium sp. RCC_202]|uniref:hypothetical protein n=1 Tax=Mesorhizobium sp. RCC_202 TaxID=3239222 RepID=UPI003525E5D2